MQTIEFKSEKINEFSGTSKAGKPFTMRKQEALLHGSGPVPGWFEIVLGENQAAYAVGLYEAQSSLAVESFRSDRPGHLVACRELSLVAIKQPAAKAA